MSISDDGNTLLIRDVPAWDRAPARFRASLGEHIDLVRDPCGEVVGVVIDSSNGFEWSDFSAFLDLAFDVVFPPATERVGRLGELERASASRWAFSRWLAPLLTVTPAA